MPEETIFPRMANSINTLNPEVSGSNSINSSGIFNIMPVDFKTNDKKIKSYKKRFWMLFLFVLLTTLSSVLFPLYVSVANVTGCYYGVSQSAVNWTIQIQMLVYVILVFPATFLMNYLDLRRTLIFSSCLLVAACAIQFLSLDPDGFPFVMLSSFFSALGNVMIVGIAPYLAAKWFPSNELSRACSFGNFGNIVGVSIGIMLIPLMISSDCEQKSLIENGKRNLAYVLLAIHSLCLILILFTFQNSPKLPPSLVQLEKKQENAITKKILLDVVTNKDFIVVLLMSGLLGSVFYTFTSVSNNLMIRFFPDQEETISWMTALFTIIGILGAICAGYILDYTHKFKEAAIAFAFMSLLFFIMFSSTLPLKKMWIQYVLASGLGFFLTGLLPIVLEYSTEVIFPVTEIISSNFVFWALQAFGLILIEIVSQLLEYYGPLPSCIAIGTALAICCVLSCFTTKNYKRSGIIWGTASSYVT